MASALGKSRLLYIRHPVPGLVPLKPRMIEKALLRADTVSDALAGVARHHVAGALAVLDDRERPGTTAVHDLRKALKRWRALLRLLAPYLGEDGRRLLIEARDIARALTSAREPRSALDAFTDLGPEPEGVSARTRATITGRLEALRSTAEAATLTDEARLRARAALQAASGQIGLWPLDRLDARAIARRLAQTFRRARRAIPADWSAASAEELHELRQRVVAHRYQMELVETLWPKLGRVWIGEAQKLRERLGAYQDLAVLTGFMAPHQPLAHWRAQLAPLIAARQQSHLAAARRLTGRIFAEKPGGFRRRIEALWASGERGD
jgi:CHAD domain-containing protein